MKENTKKKSRGVNFSGSETDILLNLIRKYAHIVECKKTDHTSNIRKNETWEKICEEFNAQNGAVNRSAAALKTKYENEKRNVRSKYAAEKKEYLRAGGGTFQEIRYSKSDRDIADILGERVPVVVTYEADNENTTDVEDSLPITEGSNDYEEIKTLNNYEDMAYSTDETTTHLFETLSTQLEKKTNCVTEKEPRHVVQRESLENCSITNNLENTSPTMTKFTAEWDNYEPHRLKEPRSTPLCSNSDETARKKQYTDKSSELTNARIGLRELQKCLIEKHQQELNLRQEAHMIQLEREGEIHLLKMEEIRLRIKLMKEKHEAEMKLIMNKSS